MVKTRKQINAYHAKWRAAHPTSVKASQIKYWGRGGKLKRKEYALKHKYNLSIQDWEHLQQAQKNKCKICKKKTSLQVDHCHKTNKIRGMLCGPCNRFIGAIEHSPSRLKNAIKYLNEKTEDQNS